MSRIIFHIDVNNAFLSWTAVDQLKNGAMNDIRLVPSAIAGDGNSRQGIILAKSTPAKKYGVTTGEPTGMALQKCRNLLCFPPDFPLYSRSSRKLFSILMEYSDRVEQFSIDEGFLEYTGMEQLFGDPLRGAQTIKDRIYQELGFTVNIGISSNKLLAKMAGELEKPNKIITLFPAEIEKKLWPLSVEELFMVGRKTVPKLHKMGIHTIGELAKYPLLLLEREFKSFGRTLHLYANGIDDSLVADALEQSEAKSIGNSTTLPYDVETPQEAHKILLSLAETVSMRLRCSQFCAQELAVVIKTTEFKVYSHQRKLLNAIDCTNAIFETSKSIFDEVWKKEPLRLLGIRAGDLCHENCVQLSILDEDWTKEKKADAAMDTLRLKYGRDTVKRSTFVGGDMPAYEGGKLKINNQIFK